jgi:hypothetical protein
MSAVPYSGAKDFARFAARTTVARLLLAIALLALVAVTALSARHPHLDKQPLLPPNSGGILVLDVSASIGSDTYSRIGEELRQLVARGGRYGLVVFSAGAYEALPPGSPASALRPLVRYFTLPKQVAPGEQPSYPTNPWTQSFTSGTQISKGLELARQIELQNKVKKPAVVLISDLADEPNDINRLTDVLVAYKRAGISLNVVPLNATETDFQRFRAIASNVLPPPPPGGNAAASAPAKAAFPTTLVLLTILVALLLGLNELRSARLRWGGHAEATA